MLSLPGPKRQRALEVKTSDPGQDFEMRDSAVPWREGLGFLLALAYGWLPDGEHLGPFAWS